GAELRDALVGPLRVEGHAAAEEVPGIEAPEHEVRVGDGRLGPAEAVARGPGNGTGAARPDPQEPALVDPRDRAAARADGGEVDRGRGDRDAELELELRDVRDLAVADDADVGARPAHVQREDAPLARPLAEVAPGDDAAREPGEDG